jgi:hypothetical protein
MNERGWQRLTVALGAVLAVLLGLTTVVILLPAGSGNPRPASAAFASQAASPTIPGSSAASASPEASPSPLTSPSPPPAAAGVPVATVVFRQMRLDAGIDPVGKARTITFSSDGPGTVTARVSNSSPLSSTRVCVAVTGRSSFCHNGSTGTVTRTTSGARTNWTVSLAGVGISTPTVDLTVTFRAAHPSLKLTGFRFDGSSQSGINGFVARIKTRAVGTLTLNANWGAKPFDYALNVGDVHSDGTGIAVKKSFRVTAPGSVQVTLANAQDPGVGRIDLTATVGWP